MSHDIQTLQQVRLKVDDLGFDYCFLILPESEFAGIEDEKFQELRKAYVEAAKALDEYLPPAEEDEDDEEEDDEEEDDEEEDDEEEDDND